MWYDMFQVEEKNIPPAMDSEALILTRNYLKYVTFTISLLKYWASVPQQLFNRSLKQNKH